MHQTKKCSYNNMYMNFTLKTVLIGLSLYKGQPKPLLRVSLTVNLSCSHLHLSEESDTVNPHPTLIKPLDTN